MKIPDAAFVYLPRPSTAKLNILPHIMEVQSPQSTNNNALTGTFVIAKEEPVNTGIKVVTVFGDNMAITINKMASDDRGQHYRLEIFPPTKLPIKRPMSIRTNMYLQQNLNRRSIARVKSAPLSVILAK